MKLYIYDHCPYCVKAHMIFGLKNLPIEVVYLLNDDEDTPIKMIGQKMVPILQKFTDNSDKPDIDQSDVAALFKDESCYMAESLDIVKYIDQKFPKQILDYNLQNSNLAIWFNEIAEILYPLTMPRWAKAALPEFATANAIAYFTKKKQAYIGDFEQHLENSEKYIERANRKLKELNNIIISDNSVNNKLSLDDINLFALLRSLSIVKNLEYPEKIDVYRKNMVNKTSIELHDNIAI